MVPSTLLSRSSLDPSYYLYGFPFLIFCSAENRGNRVKKTEVLVLDLSLNTLWAKVCLIKVNKIENFQIQIITTTIIS